MTSASGWQQKKEPKQKCQVMLRLVKIAQMEPEIHTKQAKKFRYAKDQNLKNKLNKEQYNITCVGTKY